MDTQYILRLAGKEATTLRTAPRDSDSSMIAFGTLLGFRTAFWACNDHESANKVTVLIEEHVQGGFAVTTKAA